MTDLIRDASVMHDIILPILVLAVGWGEFILVARRAPAPITAGWRCGYLAVGCALGALAYLLYGVGHFNPDGPAGWVVAATIVWPGIIFGMTAIWGDYSGDPG
jgi:hypothetical protein